MSNQGSEADNGRLHDAGGHRSGTHYAKDNDEYGFTLTRRDLIKAGAASAAAVAVSPQPRSATVSVLLLLRLKSLL